MIFGHILMRASAAGILAIALGTLGAAPAKAVPTADVLVVIDESISMAGEQAWVGGMITQLDSALVTAGVTGNRYGLVGFVEPNPAHGGPAGPHKHLVGGGDFGSAAQFATAAGTLDDNGSALEDGYEAIKFGLDNYTFRTGAAINIILIADEDRDDTTAGAITKASILADLIGVGAKVNVVVNNPFFDGTGTSNADKVLGIDHAGNWYREDGSGGFTTGAGGTVGNGSGNTENDYVNGFALDAGIKGAAWDLNKLRAGGNTATSFTEAFVAVKVQEIQEQAISEPGMFVVFGSGLLALVVLRRRRAAAI